MKADQCTKCRVNGITSVEAVSEKKDNLLMENSKSVKCVEAWCYLGDMLRCGGGAEKTSQVRVRCACKKFWELSPILTARRESLRSNGKICRAYVRSSLIYGSETWPMKVEDTHRLENTETYW
jgi:hypothetical protein